MTRRANNPDVEFTSQRHALTRRHDVQRITFVVRVDQLIEFIFVDLTRYVEMVHNHRRCGGGVEKEIEIDQP